jgi:hypothetical protein
MRHTPSSSPIAFDWSSGLDNWYYVARRSFLPLLAALLLIYGSFATIASLNLFIDGRYFDFARFHEAIHSWQQGFSLYDHTYATRGWFEGQRFDFYNLNAPHVSLLVWPLSGMTVDNAAIVWTLVNITALAVSGWLIADTLGHYVMTKTMWVIVAFVLAAVPTQQFLAAGQLTGVTTLLATAIWRAVYREQWTRAAVWIGLAWSVKLFFLPLALWLGLRRQYRASLIAVLCGVGALGTGALIFGLSEVFVWGATLRGVSWSWFTINSSVLGVLSRLHLGATLTTLFSASLAGALGIIGLWSAVRARETTASYLMAAATCCVVFPIVWVHYWWALGAPLIGAWHHRSVRVGFWCSLAGWLVPPAYVTGGHPTWWILTVGSLYSWSLLALWVGAVRASIVRSGA